MANSVNARFISYLWIASTKNSGVTVHPGLQLLVSAELLNEELQPRDKSVRGRLIQSIIRNARSIEERLNLLSETGGLLGLKSLFHPESVDIGAVVNNVAVQLYPETQNKKQSLKVEIADSLPAIRADRKYLEQILLSLMANASKFTAERGQIKVRAYQDNGNIVVQVSDTGEGIPADEQEKIFQPYYQVNRNKDRQNLHREQGRRYSDRGLGLAIAKFLVELHGGKSWLKSVDGEGSSIFFSMPVMMSVESSRS